MRLIALGGVFPVLISGSQNHVQREPVPSNEVTIYFIRHAQSEWNENKAKNAERKRMKKSNSEEAEKMPKFENDKKDSPLSDKGIEQVTTLRNWFRDQLNGCQEECTPCPQNAAVCLATSLPSDTVSAKKGTSSITSEQVGVFEHASATQACKVDELKSMIQNHFDQIVFATSNLKRAIETMLVFFSGIVEGLGAKKPQEKPEIHIVSALQETSLGTDAESSLPASKSPFENTFQQGTEAKYNAALETFPNHGGQNTLPFSFNVAANEGNLNTWRSSFNQRYDKFCEWVVDQSSSGDGGRRVFVISGHSSWLLGFFIKSFGGHLFNDDPALDKQTNLAEKVLRMTRSTWEFVKYKVGFSNAMELKLGNASMIKFDLTLSKQKSFWGTISNKCEVAAKSTQLLFGNWQVAGSCKHSSSCPALVKYLPHIKASDPNDTCPKDALKED